jgi:hypothetical protein
MRSDGGMEMDEWLADMWKERGHTGPMMVAFQFMRSSLTGPALQLAGGWSVISIQ